jgi:hypothetical protein
LSPKTWGRGPSGPVDSPTPPTLWEGALSHKAVETDQRSVYTTSVNKYFWAETDKVCAVAQKVLKEKLPTGTPGIKLEKSLSTTRDKDLAILVFRASTEWETAHRPVEGGADHCDRHPKTKKREGTVKEPPIRSEAVRGLPPKQLKRPPRRPK